MDTKFAPPCACLSVGCLEETILFLRLLPLHNTISLSRHEQVIKLCFRKGPHISFKYARHSHLPCPMMGEVPLKT